jgi:type I restriction enzyme S subunit
MGVEWQHYKIGDLFDLVPGFAFKSEDFQATGIPIIKIKNIRTNTVVLDDLSYVDQIFLQDRKDKIINQGDILITMSGNRFGSSKDTWVGKVAQFRESGTYFLNQRVGILRAKNDSKIDKRCCSYILGSDEYQNLFIAIATSSGGQANLSPTQILSADILLPSLQEQRAIAHILGTLDDKIELNRHMNETLDAIARAIFQSWFVDFDPVHAKASGEPTDSICHRLDLTPDLLALFPDSFQESERGEIPRGWRVASINDLAEINAWTLNKNDNLDLIKYVEISEVSYGNLGTIQVFKRGEEPSRARRRLRHGDTVLSTVRPERGSYFLCLNPSPHLIASTGFAVITPTKAPWSFLHTALTQPEVFQHLGHQADGGAYPAIRPEIIGKVTFVLTNDVNLLNAFQNICGPLYERAEQNRKESRTLAILRDTLLPQLLSGEVRVPIQGTA